MAKDTSTSPKASSTRADLENSVKQMIMFSIGLEFGEKDELIRKLQSLTEAQLRALEQVFEKEHQQKETLLADFFAKNPELLPEFERFSKNHVHSIYSGVEREEKKEEEQKIGELLQSSFQE